MLQVLFGDPNEKKITRYTGLVNQINALAVDTTNLTDKQLQDKTIDFIFNDIEFTYCQSKNDNILGFLDKCKIRAS